MCRLSVAAGAPARVRLNRESCGDARDGEAWLRGAEAWGDLMREVWRTPGGADALVALVPYLHEVLDLPRAEVEAVVVAAVSEEVKETMASIAERLRQEGEAKGRLEGLEQGALEERRSAVRTLVEHRFGPLPVDVSRRIDLAPRPELDGWFHRALDAKTLADVFGDA